VLPWSTSFENGSFIRGRRAIGGCRSAVVRSDHLHARFPFCTKRSVSSLWRIARFTFHKLKNSDNTKLANWLPTSRHKPNLSYTINLLATPSSGSLSCLGSVLSNPGGIRELIALSLPLIISSGFLTAQLCLDRVLLTWTGTDEAAASMPAVMLFATLFGLLNHTVLYVSVFVSQYIGAKRPERVGPVLWQAAGVSGICGIAFLGLIPLAGPIFSSIGHAPEVAQVEAEYFRSLCWVALPGLLASVIEAFFSGRSRTWTVLLISAVGLIVNVPLAYGWILGAWGFPQLGAAGAGYATLAGTIASLAVGLLLILPKRYETEFRLHTGWRFDRALTHRLLRFGIPNGLMHAVDVAGWTAFVFLIGTMSKIEGAATNIAFTINLVAFLPLVGLGQGVEILVGRRQGENRPDISAKTTYSGLWLGIGYAVLISIPYALVPDWLTLPFSFGTKAEQWAELAPTVRTLLLFVAVYTLGDAVNIVVSYALRGAGDTRFVALLAVGLAWPVLVLPTWLAAKWGWGATGAWVFATIYIGLLAIAFVIRFLGGKWRSMRVIEASVT
jgi:multidrug resistance protein, MATE family